MKFINKMCNCNMLDKKLEKGFGMGLFPELFF